MKAIIKNLGCKVNNYECEFVRELLIKNGYTIVEKEADVVVVNTCTVTNNSDTKSRKIIRRERRENPSSILVVMGCAIEHSKLDLTGIDADIYIGNKDKSKIIDYINEFKEKKEKIMKFYDMKNVEFENMEIEKFETKTRAFVKIEDGCENFCSYCVIPYVRGSVRSKDFDLVINEVKSLVKNGHKEIVLTGIHTGQYKSNGKDLGDLMEELVKIEGLEILRLSSVEITEISDKILELFKTSKKLANHFHIPLQSGSNNTLKAMNRKYDKKYFLSIINKIRSIRSDVSISTDLIVGFPTETKDDFIESLEFCKKINFSKIHVFPFSLRSGTEAEKLENIVKPIEKKERSKKMIELSNTLEKDYLEKNIDKIHLVIVETKKEEYFIGHTSNYIKVYIKSNNLNEICNVKLVKIFKDGMLCEIV